MIIKSIVLPDELGDHYQDEAAACSIPVVDLLADRLARARDLTPRERYLIVIGEDRQQLEKVLGGMPVLSPADLLQKVERVARIRFGDHELKLTAGQLEEIAHMAMKQSKTVERVLEEMWTKFCDEFFIRLPSRV